MNIGQNLWGKEWDKIIKIVFVIMTITH